MQIKKLFKYLSITAMTASVVVMASAPLTYSLNNDSTHNILNSNHQVDEVDYTDQFQYIRNDVAKQTDVTNSIKSIELAQNSSNSENFAAIVTKTDGSTLLYMWGDNKWGQLGDGTTYATSTPTKVNTNFSSAIKQIAIGEGHTIALLEDGSLYSWGGNYYGQLGNGLPEDDLQTSPTKVDTTNFGSKKVTRIASGANHCAAILADGSLYMWGTNWEGELGVGNFGSEKIPVKTYTADFTAEIKQLVLGREFSAALLKDGSLYMWGRNSEGQLGNGTEDNTATPTIQNSTSFDSKKIKKIALGDNHSAALLEDDSLYMWGFNRYGQLGTTTNSGTQDSTTTPIEVTIPNSTSRITEIALGSIHSSALLEDGSLYMWGANEYGQLGFNANKNANPKPAKVTIPNSGSKKINQINLIYSNSAIILNDGSIYIWGQNDRGQVGNSTGDSSTPTWMSKLGMDSYITANKTISAKEAVDSFWVDDNFNVDGFKKSFSLINIPETDQVITMDTEPKHNNATGTVTMNVKIKYFYNENGLPVTDTAAEEMTIIGFALPVVVEDQKPAIEDQFPWWWIVIGASAAVLIALVAMFIIKKHNEEAVESVVSGPEFE